MAAELDHIDRRILNALQDQGRLQNVDLARLVGLSPSPCLRRVRLKGQDEDTVNRFIAAVKAPHPLVCSENPKRQPHEISAQPANALLGRAAITTTGR